MNDFTEDEFNNIREEMRTDLDDFVDTPDFRHVAQQCYDMYRIERFNIYSYRHHTLFCLYLSNYNDKVHDYLRNYLKYIKLSANEIIEILFYILDYHIFCTTESLQILIDSITDINEKNSYGATLLNYCSSHIAPNITDALIDLILKKSADVNIVDKDGNNALANYLNSYGHATGVIMSKNTIMLLINAGVDYKPINYENYALSHENKEIYLNCISAYEGKNMKPAKK